MDRHFNARRHGRGDHSGPCQSENIFADQGPEVCGFDQRGQGPHARQGSRHHACGRLGDRGGPHGGPCHRQGGGEGRGSGSGRRGRLLNHGDLRLITLALIEEKPRHGYEVIKAIEEKVGGAYAPSPGVIYPTLTLLEELGHVTVTAHDGKKMHTITPDGHTYLEANRASVEVLKTKMATIQTTYGQAPSPEIIRAMENMRLALQLRLAAGPMATESARAIAESLDKVALLIERHST